MTAIINYSFHRQHNARGCVSDFNPWDTGDVREFNIRTSIGHMPIFPPLERMRQENCHSFEAILAITRPSRATLQDPISGNLEKNN